MTQELTAQLSPHYARIGKALSSPARVEILAILLQSRKSVETLAEMTRLSIANVSKHLQVLLNARLVSNEKYKNYVYYQLASAQVRQFIYAFHQTAEHQLAEIAAVKSEFLATHVPAEAITLEKLTERMNNNEVILIDVRPSDEFEYAHIPGAISIPIAELAHYIAQFPADKTIVAYCRGPYCLLSSDAVQLLKQQGKQALRLAENVHDWQQYQQNH